MAGIQQAGHLVDKVVVDKHLVPRSDEIDIDVVGDIEITIHSQETRKGTINGVMESHAVETVFTLFAQEVLIVGRRQVGGDQKTTRTLSGCATTTTAKE